MNVFLQSERLSLTAVTAEHCNEKYLSWLHDYDVNRFMETDGRPSSLEALKSYVENINNKNTLFLAIHLKENGNHIGNIKLSNIRYIHGTAEFSLLLGDKNEWGKGYAKEASILLIDHGFKRLNLRRLMLGVIKEHLSAFHLYKNLGFIEEGIYRQHSFYDGELRDAVIMGLLKNEWKG